jgi:hypothetical protein
MIKHYEGGYATRNGRIRKVEYWRKEDEMLTAQYGHP